MANLAQAVLCSVLPAPHKQALVLEAALFAPQRQMQLSRRKPRLVTVACSTAKLPIVGNRTMPSCSEHVEGTLARGNTLPTNTEREVRIRKHLMMENPEYFPSSYDTAWVAMVPLPGSNPEAPYFPQCVEWIHQNQHDNGSWGADEFDVSVNKDILLSTLACAIALKKWNFGSEQIKRGLQFVAKNVSVILDNQIKAPVGFNLTFPALVSLAIKMGLEFPTTGTCIDGILRLRNMELERLAGDKCPGKESYLANVAEGLVSSPLDWNIVTKFQRQNGSLFNSPAATAAALFHNYDEKALHYLDTIVNIFGGAVPTVYPLNIYSRLSMVDTLSKIGISRHFSSEIKSILDNIFILWSDGDDEVMLDVETCAMAFRILRMNGYDVSSEELSHVAEALTFHNSIEGYIKDTKTLLELYKASKVSLSENEPILDKIGYWSGSLLKEKLCPVAIKRIPLLAEVDYGLKFPFYATVDPLDHKRNIEHFEPRVYHNIKTKNLPCHVNQDILALGVEDFSRSQSMYQAELQLLQSWYKENKLDLLQFSRKNLINCYLTAAVTISPHELSDARVACAKTVVLVTVLDDFYDIEGSEEELKNLTSFVQNWDHHDEAEFYSEHVKVVFSALYGTINELGAKASVLQNRDVTKYIVESWLDFLRSCETDAEWQRRIYVPTMEEYMTNATDSIALGPIIHTTQYFLGKHLWEDVVKYQEYKVLFRLLSSCGRLRNDIQGFEREFKDGKLNSVSLLVLQSKGSMSIEAAKNKIQEYIDSDRRELLRLILREDSPIPKPCREMVWKLYKTSHMFYSEADGFSSPKEMMGALNAVISEPLQLEANSPSLANQLKNKNTL